MRGIADILYPLRRIDIYHLEDARKIARGDIGVWRCIKTGQGGSADWKMNAS